MLELSSPDGAFEEIESYLRERGFFVPGGEELEADLYLGYALSGSLRRHASPFPPSRARFRCGGGDSGRVPGTVPGTGLDWTLGTKLERYGVRRRGRVGADGDRSR